MFYVIAVRGWPVLVWLAAHPPAHYQVLSMTADALAAMAAYHEALDAARRRRAAAYLTGGEKTMSPVPPDAKNKPTYDSLR